MFNSRVCIFAGSILLGAGLLVLFAAGFFNRPATQVAVHSGSPLVKIAQDSGQDDGNGDAEQGTEVQQSEQDEQNQEGDPGHP